MNVWGMAEGIVSALKFRGWDAEINKPWIRRELHQYDAVFIGIAPPLGMNAGYSPASLHTYIDARKLDIPVVLFQDDWRIEAIELNFDTFSSERRILDLLRVSQHYRKAGWERLADNPKEVEELLYLWATEDFPLTLMPAFGWGDFSKAVVGSRFRIHRTIDLGYFFEKDRPAFVAPYQKQRKWILDAPSPLDHEAWYESLDLTWPVDFYGHKKKGLGRIDQERIVQEYAEVAAALAPVYPHAGSGWWRGRYFHAAAANTIMYVGEDDAEALGEPFQVTPQQIESMTDRQREDMAYEQAKLFWSYVESPEVVSDKILKAIEESTCDLEY